MKRSLQYGTKEIVFILSYQSRKSLGIKVHPDTSVHVLAPVDANETEILRKVKAKAPWILKQIAHFNSFRPATPPRRFINGETHLYLGRQYRLKISPDTVNHIKAYRGLLCIHSTNPTKEVLEKQLQTWYRQRASIIFEEMLEEVLPKFKRYKIQKPDLVIRKMSKRWGSCTPDGKIILNTELVKAPKGSIEYVVVHELCHLIHRNHTKPFFNLINRVLPDWKKWKERLEYCLV